MSSSEQHENSIIAKRSQAHVCRRKPLFDLEKIRWMERISKSGRPFQLSADKKNAEFQALLAFLKEIRRATIGDWYVWLFPDDKVIGRRLPHW